MSYKIIKRAPRYAPPSDGDAVDSLTDVEFKYAPTERAAIARGRSKAWAEYRANGPVGHLRALCQGTVGDFLIIEGYTRSSQISAIVKGVSIDEGAHLQCSVEYSLVDAAPTGVRVTLMGFTR